jgi:hypothetical protein
MSRGSKSGLLSVLGVGLILGGSLFFKGCKKEELPNTALVSQGVFCKINEKSVGDNRAQRGVVSHTDEYFSDKRAKTIYEDYTMDTEDSLTLSSFNLMLEPRMMINYLPQKSLFFDRRVGKTLYGLVFIDQTTKEKGVGGSSSISAERGEVDVAGSKLIMDLHNVRGTSSEGEFSASRYRLFLGNLRESNSKLSNASFNLGDGTALYNACYVCPREGVEGIILQGFDLSKTSSEFNADNSSSFLVLPDFACDVKKGRSTTSDFTTLEKMSSQNSLIIMDLVKKNPDFKKLMNGHSFLVYRLFDNKDSLSSGNKFFDDLTNPGVVSYISFNDAHKSGEGRLPLFIIGDFKFIDKKSLVTNSVYACSAFNL